MALHSDRRSKSVLSVGADLVAIVLRVTGPTRAVYGSCYVSHMCYARRMADVASRDLRNNTRALLERVEAGESITITVDGRPVATLEPARRPRFMARDRFVRELMTHRADPGLLRDIRELAPDTTDDLPLR